MDALLDRVEDLLTLDLQDSVCLIQVVSTIKHCFTVCLSLSLQYGETVLIFACKNRNLKLVKRLLSMRANPNLSNNVSHIGAIYTLSVSWLPL